jgi:hypothetical protein
MNYKARYEECEDCLIRILANFSVLLILYRCGNDKLEENRSITIVCEETDKISPRIVGSHDVEKKVYYEYEAGLLITQSMRLYNDQRNAQVFNLFIYLLLPYMFRAFF